MIVVGIWKGDILVADFVELEKLDASEIYPGEFLFLVANDSSLGTKN